jgi:hypothetical protein
LAGLLRQLVFGRLDHYQDVNDGGRLCRDPVMCAGRWQSGDHRVCRIGQPDDRFENEGAEPTRELRRSRRSAQPRKPNRKAASLKILLDCGKTPQIPSRQRPAEPKMVNKNLTIVN